jgi:site-specific DNA recombinase
MYAGSISQKGKSYSGEHTALLPSGTWERVQTLISSSTAIPHGRARNKHLALLNGLLYCEACAARMVYSYASKNGRKYPYYLCLNAQRKGWAVCPAKSLPAQALEDSVLGQIRQAHPGTLELGAWEQMDRTGQVEAMRAIVERIGYDGITRQISIRFQQVASKEAKA